MCTIPYSIEAFRKAARISKKLKSAISLQVVSQFTCCDIYVNIRGDNQGSHISVQYIYNMKAFLMIDIKNLGW